MSHTWQIEHTRLHDTTDVTVRNVKSQHIPLQLNGSKAANSILIQLLRCAGFAEEGYHSNHGWGPTIGGRGIVIRQRHRNGAVPEHATLYELAADTESKLMQAARQYAPIAQYLASSASQPDLSAIETMLADAEQVHADHDDVIDELRAGAADNRAKIANLNDRTTRLVDEIAELRGNVGELINTPGSTHGGRTSLNSKVRRLWSRSETVYDTLYHGGNGVLTRISSLEGTRQDTLDLPKRVQALENALYRLVTALNRDPGTQTNYTATFAGSVNEDACLLNHEVYDEQVEFDAYLKREETTDAEANYEAGCDGDSDPLPF